jgi:hypothetical protein
MDTQTNDMNTQGLEELILVTPLQRFVPFMETKGPLHVPFCRLDRNFVKHLTLQETGNLEMYKVE